MTERRPSRLQALLGASAIALPLLAVPPPAGAELVLGEPSVQSQRGQRLKLALPYGSAPGERVSVTRFTVVSVSVPPGWAAPDAAAFTLLKPERRNLVYLRSAEPVTAPEVTLTVRVTGQDGPAQAWRITMPEAAFARPAATPDQAGSAPPDPRRGVPRRSARAVQG